ncbi:MAG TPA: hypothetical protein VNG71_02855 [Pyrinomonadaceae bacterium]|nr:hypothetical protein [Pyrinomonadaceae bacterium]
MEPLDKDGKLRPMSFEGMKVGGPLFLSRAVFKRPVNFYAAQIGGNFVADDEAHFESDAVFELMKIGARAVFDKAKFDGRTSFYSVKVAENFDASEAYFNDTKHGVIFEGMSVDAALFSGSHFKGPARFYGMTASSSLDLSGVDFYKVTEDMATDDQAKNDKITAFVNFQGMAIKGSFFLRRSIFNRGVSFYGTSVDREFSADAAQFNDPQSGVFFNNLKTDTIGLSGAVFRGPISLSGVTYREVDRDSLDNLVSVIRQANYDAGAYFELEAYYRTHGAISQADDVYIEQRRRERRGLWFPARWSEALFVDLPLGYGRHIWRLIVPSAILIGIGCYVFRSKELMEPQAPEYACRHYSRFLYSLGLFLPIVDLRSDVWLPKHERRAARRYLPFHIIAGWVLVTLLVGALTGILK